MATPSGQGQQKWAVTPKVKAGHTPASAYGGEKRAANAPVGVCRVEKDEREEEGTAPSLRGGVGAGEKV